MKFGKQFESQQVPEWKEVYCDYRSLKQIVKDIRKLRKESGIVEPQLHRKVSNFRRLISGLHHQHHHHHHHHQNGLASPKSPESPAEQEEELILIERRESEHGVEFQTSFLSQQESDELDRVFFRRLDEELSKVNKFYQMKEREVREHAATLDTQMEALLSAKQTLQNIKQEQGQGSSHGGVQLEPLQSVQGVISRRRQLEPVEEDTRVDGIKQVKIDIPAANPTEAISALLSDIAGKSLLNFNIRKVKKAESMLQAAFVEFYQLLCLLRNYSSLNLIAFGKVLKKYDKVTSRQLSKRYLRVVESSYVGKSDKIQKLMDKAEALFTKHFTDLHRQKAMEILRPETRRERHRVTFFIGVFSGLSIALLVALLLTIRIERLYDAAYSATYMDAVFPIFSMLTAVLLHLYLYGLNIYFWRKTWINHSFILGLKRGLELRYRDVFLLATGLSSLALCALIVHLQLTVRKECCKSSEELIPFLVVAGAIVLLVLPFNVLYRSTRFFFLQALWHCLLTPFYKVVITDFLVADQLTSQVPALRDLEYVLCYYGGGFFKTRNSNACLGNHLFRTFGFVIAILPYWCRMLQCLRRWYDESDKIQIYNAVKYFAAILAVASRMAYLSRRNSLIWRTLTFLLSVFATIVATYWDIVLDWGLLCRNSENPWLRDKLAISYKSAYYFAIISNVFLRFAWLQSLIDVKIEGLNPKGLSLVVACLEVIRRGQWNYYRLENEHFNNVGKYRAVQSVPLPFVD